MLFQLYHHLYSWIIQAIDRFTQTRFWQWKYLFFLVVYMLVTSFPNYHLLRNEDREDARKTAQILEVTDWMNRHPLQNFPQDYAPYQTMGQGIKSHYAKRITRLTVPLLCHLLHISANTYLFFQHLLGIIFFGLLLRFMLRHCNAPTAILTGFIFANLFAGKWFFYDFYYYDPTAYFLLFAAAYFRQPLLIFLLVIAAGFTDERAVIACIGLLGYWAWQENDKQSVRWASLFHIRQFGATYAVAAGIPAYVVLRFAVIRAFDLQIDRSMIGLPVIFTNFNALGLALALTFEGGWVLISSALLLLGYRKEWISLTLFAGGLTAIILAGSMALDLTRSYSYGFLVLIFSVVYLYRHEEPQRFQKLLLAVALSCCLFPTYLLVSSDITWLSPILPKIRLLLS